MARLPKYKTAKELQAAIDKYFTSGVKRKTIIVGGARVDIEVPTISGLCYELGFQSRQSFYDMEKVPELTYTIKRARLFMEKEYEEMLQVGNTTGAIFALKNFGWIDKQVIDYSGMVNVEPIKWVGDD